MVSSTGWKRPRSRCRVVKRMRQAQGRGTWLEADRTVELGRIVEVIENDQGVGATVELLEGGPELLIGRLVECLGPKLGPDLGEPLSERFGGVDPEDAAGVVMPFPTLVDIFDGELGLANASHAGKAGGPDADGLLRLKGGAKLVEIVAAADEVGVASERYEEEGGPESGPSENFREPSGSLRVLARWSFRPNVSGQPPVPKRSRAGRPVPLLPR